MAELPFSVENYTVHDTLEDALEALSADMEEPWSWNQWQKACSVLRAHYAEASDDNRYLSTLRKQLMEKKFGAQWQSIKANPLREQVLQRVQREEEERPPPASPDAIVGGVGAPIPEDKEFQPEPASSGRGAGPLHCFST